MTESDFYYNGLHCLVNANEMGHRCGYVGTEFELSELENVDVHGGLTFSGQLNGFGTLPSSSKEKFYYGFDCGHSGDAKDESIMTEEYKKIYSQWNHLGGVVRTKEYVEQQCRHLADQLVPLIKVAQYKKRLVEEILQ